LQAWLTSSTDWRAHRAVVFLVPFGMHVPWSIIEELAKTKAIEVMINFPLAMAIQRFLTKSGEISERFQADLDTFFGSQEWRGIVYEKTTGLFGDRVEKRLDAGERLLAWYRTRLKERFGHVSTPRLIKNTRGNPLYHIIWAGPHEKGLKGANYILSQGEALPGKKRSKA
jgi:three-Cys-motif partner protein